MDGIRHDGPRDQETLVAALELVAAEAARASPSADAAGPVGVLARALDLPDPILNSIPDPAT